MSDKYARIRHETCFKLHRVRINGYGVGWESWRDEDSGRRRFRVGWMTPRTLTPALVVACALDVLESQLQTAKINGTFGDFDN